jgi:hypothetical protein
MTAESSVCGNDGPDENRPWPIHVSGFTYQEVIAAAHPDAVE